MMWVVSEIGDRPVDAEIVRDERSQRTEMWWRGVQIAYVADRDLLLGGQAVLDWNQIRKSLGTESKKLPKSDA